MDYTILLIYVNYHWGVIGARGKNLKSEQTAPFWRQTKALRQRVKKGSGCQVPRN